MKLFTNSLAILCLAALPATAADPATALWFSTPATKFEQSLPLGNGRMGAMIFGGVDEERIVLNESSLWSGSPADNDRADAFKALPEIRRLLAEGKNPEAADLVMKNFTCQGAGSGNGNGANVPFGCYQTLGNLRLNFGDAPEATVAQVRQRTSRLVRQSGSRVCDGRQRRNQVVHHPRRQAGGLGSGCRHRNRCAQPSIS